MIDRTKVFIPQGSIIGMMLKFRTKKIVVRSTALGGLAQHDTFSWQVEDKHFVQLDETNSDSQQVDTTFKEWVETVLDTELQLYFDLFLESFLMQASPYQRPLPSRSLNTFIIFVQAQSLTPKKEKPWDDQLNSD